MVNQLRDYCPLVLDLRNKECLVVGGGTVALRKVKTLLTCGARVLVVSPSLCQGLQELIESEEVQFAGVHYQSYLLDTVFLVVSSTDDRELNRRVSRDCLSRQILVNNVDDPSHCNFFFPSVVSRGALSIAISTEGKSPAWARMLREQLEEMFSTDCGAFLDFLGKMRPRVIQSIPDLQMRKEVFQQLAGREFYHFFQTLGAEELNQKAAELIEQYKGKKEL